MTAAVRLVRDWAFDEAGRRAPRDRRGRATTSPRNVWPSRPAFAARASSAAWPGARRARATTCCTRCCPATRGPGPATRGPGELGWPRLADGRLRRPALRAGRCPGRPGRLRRPGRRPLDPRSAGAVQPRRRRVVHRGCPAPARGRGARPARRDRRGHRRAARQRQPRPLRRPRRRPRSATGSSGMRAAGAWPWGRRASSSTGRSPSWASSASSCSRTPSNEASQALAGRLGFTRESLLRGFLAPEAGKSRKGRVVPSADGSLPPRDDQVQFVRLRSDPAPPS